MSLLDVVGFANELRILTFHWEIPLNGLEVYDLLNDTGMLNLGHISPVMILAFARSRQCTNRRAEAITSAVGATDWLLNSNYPRDEVLVLNYCPLLFLREMREKVGSAIFFGSAPRNTEDYWEFMGKYLGHSMEDSELESSGSLLPFTPAFVPDALYANVTPWISEHDTVKYWIIEQSGSVRVLEAAIVSSSTIQGILDDDCILLVPFVDAELAESS